MMWQMLRSMRVKSKQELAEQIYKYFDEVNEASVVISAGHTKWMNLSLGQPRKTG